MNSSFSKCLLDYAKWNLDANKIGYNAKIIQCHHSPQTQKMETRKRLKRNTKVGYKKKHLLLDGRAQQSPIKCQEERVFHQDSNLTLDCLKIPWISKELNRLNGCMTDKTTRNQMRHIIIKEHIPRTWGVDTSRWCRCRKKNAQEIYEH